LLNNNNLLLRLYTTYTYLLLGVNLNNSEVLNKYLLERMANGIREATRLSDTSIIKKLDGFLNKPFRQITKEDMVRFTSHLMQGNLKASYIHIIKYKLKFFFNWLYDLERGVYPECVRWMRTYNPRADTKSGGMTLPVKPKDLLTEHDILRLANAATHPRDQALVMLAYECGGRASEILNLKIESVQFGSRIGHVTLEGNIGARQLPIVTSVPYLQTWINLHPHKHDAGAYLFPSLKGKTKGQRMEYHNYPKILRRLRRDAKIQKPVRPHLLRHARLTKLAKERSDAWLKTFAGWTQGSRMTGVYVHLSGEDLDQGFLEMHGLAEKEAPKETPLKNQVCVRGHENPGEATYCNDCGIILDPKQGLEQKQQAEEIEELGRELEKTKTIVNGLQEFIDTTWPFQLMMVELYERFKEEPKPKPKTKEQLAKELQKLHAEMKKYTPEERAKMDERVKRAVQIIKNVEARAKQKQQET